MNNLTKTKLNPRKGLNIKYNTPANLDHQVNLIKTINFTYYEINEEETQCCLQGSGGH
jgi:hypothetical protein